MTMKITLFKKWIGLMVTTILILFGSTASKAADYYWVGGTGVWTQLSHWATTSGGSTNYGIVPTPIDNVIFDANSFPSSGGTVTINFEAFCRNFVVDNIPSNVTFQFNSGLNVENLLDVTPVNRLTWNQATKLYFKKGGTIGNVFLNMTSGTVQVLKGNLKLENNAYFKKGGSEMFSLDTGTLEIDSACKFEQCCGTFNSGYDKLIVKKGATFINQASKIIRNGSFVADAGSIVTVTNQWQFFDAGYEISKASIYSKANGSMYFYATRYGQHNIGGAGKDLHRVELGGNNFNAEWKLTDTLIASNDGVWLNANKLISNGYHMNVFRIYYWNTTVAALDLTGTDTVKLAYEFRIYPFGNFTHTCGDATILFAGTNSFYFYGGNKVHKDVIFRADNTGSSQVYMEYPGVLRDVTLIANGSQYLDVSQNSSFRHFTLFYKNTSVANASPAINFNSNHRFTGTFKMSSAGSNIKPKLYLGGTDTFNIVQLDNIREWSIASNRVIRVNQLMPLNGTCQSTILLHSATVGASAFLLQTTDTVKGNWLLIQDVTGYGGAIFRSDNTINLGNATGWIINTVPPQTMYWIGGNGNWDDPTHWSLTSGGSAGCAIPSRIDSVVFDTNSFNGINQYCNVNIAAAECRSMIWTNARTGSGLSGNQTLSVFGHLVLHPNMNMNFNGTLQFMSPSMNTLTTANKYLNCTVSFQGSNNSNTQYILQDSLKTNGYVYLYYGNLKANSFNIEAYSMICVGYQSSLDLRGGTNRIKLKRQWTINNATTLYIGDANIEFNSSDYMSFESYGAQFNPKVYNNIYMYQTNTSTQRIEHYGSYNKVKNLVVEHNGNGNMYFPCSRDTFENVSIHYYRNFKTVDAYLQFHDRYNYYGTFKVSGTGENTPRLEIVETNSRKLQLDNLFSVMFWPPSYTHIYDTISINGSCLRRTNVMSSSVNSAATITVNSRAYGNYLSLRDLTVNGAGIIDSARNSAIVANVTNWKVTGGRNFYWIGGAGNWNDPNRWSLSSGGSTAGCVPGSMDNVFFDVNSFTAANQQVTVDYPGAYFKNMLWNNVNSPRIGGSNEIHCYGSFVLASNLTWSHGGWLYFQSRDTGNIVDPKGVTLYLMQFLAENSYKGGWVLANHLRTSHTIYFRSGKVRTAGYQISALSIWNDYNDSRLGWDMTGTDTVFVRSELYLGDNSNVLASGTTFKFHNMSNYYRFYSNANIVKNLVFDHQIAAQSEISIYGSTTLTNIDLVSSGWPQINFNGAGNFNDLNFHFTNTTGNVPKISFQSSITANNVSITATGNGGPHLYLYQNNTFNNLITSGNGTRMYLGAGRTQTVNGVLALGNGSYPVIVKSTVDGTQAIIHKPTGKVCLDFVLMQDCKATSTTATSTIFNAGASSVNLGNNTNWLFASCGAYYWVGDNGNWSDYANHWARTSGGTQFHTSAPGPDDDVYFDANSFTTTGRTVNIDVDTAKCRDMKWSSAAFVPTVTGVGEIKIYGDLHLISAMNQNHSGEWKFVAPDAHVINTAGKSLTSVRFNGTGSWTLTNPLDVSGDINLDQGTFITSGKSVSARNFNSTTSNTRSLQLGSSTFTINEGAWNPATLTNTTLVEGTSTIVVQGSGNTAAFLGNNLTYNNVTFSTGSTFTATLKGSNVFNTLKVGPGLTLLADTVVQTMSAFTAIGTCPKMITIRSLVAGTRASFSKSSGVVNSTFLNLKDMRAMGGATWKALFSNDQGNNTGWTFTPPPSLSIATSNTFVNCQTNNNGTASVTGFSGGIAPYTYLWSTTETTPSISNLIPGQYTVTVTDSVGCRITETVNVTNYPAQITPTEFSASALDVCKGTSINFTAGTPPEPVASYRWNFGDFSSSTNQNPSKNYTSAGTYNVTLSYIDTNGCPSTVNKTVRVSDITRTVNSTPVTCFGNNDGSITVSASGGITPYSYSLNGTTWQSSPTFSGLAPGTYTVRVRDSILCNGTNTTVTITSPTAALSASASATGTSTAVAADGSITVNASGGTSPYMFSINGGILFVSTNVFQNLPAGSYTVVARDSRNCVTASQTVVVPVPDIIPPVISCPSDIVVNVLSGCSRNVSFSAAATDNIGVTSLTYSVNPGSAFNVGTTNVVATARDAAGNFATCTLKVIVKDTIVPVARCRNFTVYLNGSHTGSVTAANLDNGCSDNCGTVNVSILSGKTSFVCDDRGQNFNLELKVTDASGNFSICNANVRVSDSLNPVPVLSATNTGPVCVGDTIKLFTAPGSSHSWTGPDGYSSSNQNPVILNATSAMDGIYNVRVVGGTGCTTNAGTTVTVKALPTVTVSSNSPVCNGNRLTLSTNTNSLYFWNGPNGFSSTVQQPSISGITAAGEGRYYLKAQGSNGCRDSASTYVEVKPLPTISISSVGSPSICAGNTVELEATVNIAYTYQWMLDGADITGATGSNYSASVSGKYSVRVTDNFGCVNVSNSITVTIISTTINLTCPSDITVYRTSAMNVPAVDQSNLSGNNSAGGNDQWQSFTAGTSGNLTQLDIQMSSPLGSSSAAATIRIYKGNGIQGEELAVQNITITPNNALKAFTLSDKPLLVAGEMYTWRLEVPLMNVGFIRLNPNNSYAGGAAGNISSWDYTFRTWMTGTENCSASVTVPQPSANSACPGNISFTNNITVGSNASGTYPVGTTTINWTATHQNGTTATCSMTVTVIDNTAPQVICPADIAQTGAVSVVDQQNLSTNAGAGSTDQWQSFTAGKSGKLTQLSLGVSSPLVNSSSSGVLYIYSGTGTGGTLLATQNVTFQYLHNTMQTFTFAAPASITAGQVYTYRMTVPSINVGWVSLSTSNPYSGGQASASSGWDFKFITHVQQYQNCSAYVKVPFPSVLDNCSGITAVNSLNGTNNASGLYPLGTTTVNWTFTDASGNRSFCSHNVTLTNDNPPNPAASNNGPVCPGRQITLSASGGIAYSWTGPNGFTSNLQNPVINSAITAHSGTYTVTVTGGLDCKATASTVVDVADYINPTVITKDAVTYLDANGNATITAADVNNGSFDNCDIASVKVSPETFTCANLGNNTVSLKVTDQSGNSSTGNANVVVKDTIRPIIVCLNDITVNNAAGACSTFIKNYGLSVRDNCGISSISNSFNGGKDASGNYPVGLTTVTWTVKDISGNVSTCVQKVIVIDNELPVVKTRNITVDLSASGNAGIDASMIDDHSYDNCGVDSLYISPSRFDCSNVGNNTVTLWVRDIHGNIQTGTATVLIRDVTAPVVYTQNIARNLDANGNLSILASEIDNNSSDECGVRTVSVYPDKFNCSNVGANTVTLKVTDVNGNSSSSTAVVTISDVTPPTVYTNNLTVDLDATGVATITAASVNNNSKDACGIDTFYLDNYRFDCDNVGNNTVTLTVFDRNGNSATSTATINVRDLVKPVLNIQNITVDLDASGNVSINRSDIGDAQDACGIASMTLSKYSFDCSNVGNNTITFTAVDVNGNTTSGTATVTVRDVTNPVTRTRNITIDLNAAGAASITATQIDNGSDDACGIDSLFLDNYNFSCTNVGDNTVTLTAIDVNGNRSSETATVTVRDVTAPTVNVNNITIDLDADGNASITASQIDNTSTDVCGIDTIYLDNYTFTCDNVGSNTVDLTVVDINGNSASATATVTVRDVTAPVITVQNITVNLDASGNVTIDRSDIGDAQDACGIASMSLSKYSFDCSNVGSNTITFTAVDVNGNSRSGTATVTVRDITNPIVETRNITIDLNAAGVASITVAQIDNGSNDACGIASMTLSNYNFDCSNVGSNTVTLTVTDNNGNTSSETATVTVRDVTAPVVNVNNITIDLSSTGSATIAPADIDNGSDDACGIDSLYLSQYVFNCSHVGSNTVTLTAIDVNGNSTSRTATVTVRDVTAPTVITRNITIDLSSTGSASIVPADVNNGSNDACGIASYDVTPNTFGCSNVGSNTVTLKVTDVNGNINTETAVVTVRDVTAPAANCQAVTITLNNGTASVTASQINNGSSDACGIASMQLSKTSFNCSNIGSNSVILTVTDVNGNVSRCTTTVTVVGSIPSANITAAATSSTYTGGVPTTIYLGYGSTGVVLTANPSTGSPFTYLWEDSTGLSSLTNQSTTFTPTAEGNYTKYVTVTNQYGCTVRASKNICVLDVRSTGVGSSQKVYLCHVPPGNPNNPQTLNISVSAVSSHLGNHDGDRLGNCSQSCSSSKKGVAEGEMHVMGEADLVVYPNPSNNTFNFIVETHDLSSKVNLKIYDASGKMVMEVKDMNPNEEFSVGEELKAGVYFAEVSQGGFMKVVKIVKLH